MQHFDKKFRLCLVILFQLHQHFVSSDKNILRLEIRESKENDKTKIDFQDGFNNIPELLESKEGSGNLSKGSYTQLCGRGVFLVYDAPLFATQSGTIDGVSLFTKTELDCVSFEEIGTLGSARTATNAHYKSSQITIFSGKNFQGGGELIATGYNTNSKFHTYPDLMAGSMIVFGQTTWLIIWSDYTETCVIPQGTGAFCLISSLIDKKIKPGTTIKHVIADCKGKYKSEQQVVLSDCYTVGQGYIKPLSPSFLFGDPGNDTDENGTKPGSSCIYDDSNDFLTTEQKYLIEGRLNGTIGTGDWMAALENAKNVWRTELFDKCLRIFMYVCDASIIEPEFLIMFASLYFHHLDKAWREGSEFSYVEFKEDEWMEINHNMDECTAAVAAGMYAPSKEAIIQATLSYKNLKELTDKVDEMLGMRPKLDYILEIHWFMANLVASVCHDAVGGTTNFVTKFWNVYHPLYLTPIVEAWKNPGNITTAYKYIFGGYGMEKSFAKIGYCTYSTMIAAHAMEPYLRPMEQKKEIFLPKYGEYDEEEARKKGRKTPEANPPPANEKENAI